jgi:hypothetical protein
LRNTSDDTVKHTTVNLDVESCKRGKPARFVCDEWGDGVDRMEWLRVCLDLAVLLPVVDDALGTV